MLENVPPEGRPALKFGGRASIIFPVNVPLRESPGIEAIGAALLAVPREQSACAILTGDSVNSARCLLDSDFTFGLQLGWAVFSTLRAAERFAEAVELLDLMETAARSREDALALYRIKREQSWLCETSAEGAIARILPTAGPDTTQLSLPFV